MLFCTRGTNIPYLAGAVELFEVVSSVLKYLCCGMGCIGLLSVSPLVTKRSMVLT